MSLSFLGHVRHGDTVYQQYIDTNKDSVHFIDSEADELHADHFTFNFSYDCRLTGKNGKYIGRFTNYPNHVFEFDDGTRFDTGISDDFIKAERKVVEHILKNGI